MSEVLTQSDEEEALRAHGSGLFTEEAAARMTAAFSRTVARARAENLLFERLDAMERQVDSLRAEVAEVRSRESQLRRTLEELAGKEVLRVAETEASYPAKS